MNKAKSIAFLLLLIGINVGLGAAAHLGHIPIKYALYAFWGQCALLGTAVFFIYAKHLVVFFIMLAIAGFIIGLKDETIWQDLQVPATFWGIYSFCWLFYFEFGKTKLGQWIRYLHPLQSFLFYLIYMGIAIAASFSATASIYKGWDLVHDIPKEMYFSFLALSAVIPTVSIGALKVIDIVGAGHIFHFLIGTYHRPVSRQKIVLFLDMVGSSSIAERLEPKDSMAFIARFIFDASLAFRIKGGDIVNYTGDGLVVLWPLDKADNAVESVDTLTHIINKNKDYYKKKFGIVPSFRIGIHGGEVIISQIGEEKLFLGLYGDVVNTAARLEQMCKEIGTHLLFSKTVRQYMSLSMKNQSKHLGKRDVRGREGKIDVFTLLHTQPEDRWEA